MKFGILTFQSQLNYISPVRMRGRRGDYAGCGVLQCWARKCKPFVKITNVRRFDLYLV